MKRILSPVLFIVAILCSIWYDSDTQPVPGIYKTTLHLGKETPKRDVGVKVDVMMPPNHEAYARKVRPWMYPSLVKDDVIRGDTQSIEDKIMPYDGRSGRSAAVEEYDSTKERKQKLLYPTGERLRRGRLVYGDGIRSRKRIEYQTVTTEGTRSNSEEEVASIVDSAPEDSIISNKNNLQSIQEGVEPDYEATIYPQNVNRQQKEYLTGKVHFDEDYDEIIHKRDMNIKNIDSEHRQDQYVNKDTDNVNDREEVDSRESELGSDPQNVLDKYSNTEEEEERDYENGEIKRDTNTKGTESNIEDNRLTLIKNKSTKRGKETFNLDEVSDDKIINIIPKNIVTNEVAKAESDFENNPETENVEQDDCEMTERDSMDEQLPQEETPVANRGEDDGKFNLMAESDENSASSFDEASDEDEAQTSITRMVRAERGVTKRRPEESENRLTQVSSLSASATLDIPKVYSTEMHVDTSETSIVERRDNRKSSSMLNSPTEMIDAIKTEGKSTVIIKKPMNEEDEDTDTENRNVAMSSTAHSTMRDSMTTNVEDNKEKRLGIHRSTAREEANVSPQFPADAFGMVDVIQRLQGALTGMLNSKQLLYDMTRPQSKSSIKSVLQDALYKINEFTSLQGKHAQ